MPAALFDAVQRARFKQVALLLNKKANIAVRDERGQCLLMAALRIEDSAKRARMFEMLLKRGAPCLVRDNEERGVLEWAVKLEREEQVKVIIDEVLVNYDLARRDRDGFTALHYAAMSGNATVARLVVDAFRRQSVPVDVPDALGLTPLMHAQRLARSDVVAILQRAGGSVGRSDHTYHLNMREWERRGREERLAAGRRDALREISRLKMLGQLNEASRRLLQLRWPDAVAAASGGAAPKDVQGDARGVGWQAPDARALRLRPPLPPRPALQPGPASAAAPVAAAAAAAPNGASPLAAIAAAAVDGAGCGSNASVTDDGRSADVANQRLLASSWPPPRLARGVSYRSLASDSSGGGGGGADLLSSSYADLLPALLEAYGYRKAGSYRTAAPQTLASSTASHTAAPVAPANPSSPRLDRSPAKFGPGSRQGRRAADAAASRRVPGEDARAPAALLLPPLSEHLELSQLSQQPQSAASLQQPALSIA